MAAIGATSANLAASILNYGCCSPLLYDEQRQIAVYFDARCPEIDKVIETKQSIIADLKAHKQSLIYEIVTGKREK